MKKYILLSPAKINLWLKILGKREDGYHELNSLVRKISLFDIVKLSESSNDIVKFHNFNIHPFENTVYKALEIFKERVNLNKNFKIDVVKFIPTGAGLGGGSSNAGVLLNFLNQYAGNPLSFGELLSLGSEIGADVPLFISSRQVILMEGIGERLSFPNIGMDNFWVLLVKPDFSVSTKWAYKNLNFKLTNKLKSINKPHPKHSDFVNDLEEPVIKEYKEIEMIKHILEEKGSDKSLMSGSGSVVYGLFKEKTEAKSAEDFIKSRFESFTTYLTKFL